MPVGPQQVPLVAVIHPRERLTGVAAIVTVAGPQGLMSAMDAFAKYPRVICLL